MIPYHNHKDYVSIYSDAYRRIANAVNAGGSIIEVKNIIQDAETSIGVLIEQQREKRQKASKCKPVTVDGINYKSTNEALALSGRSYTYIKACRSDEA